MRALSRLITSGLLTIYAASAAAASLEITPVTVELEANQNGQVLKLRNSGEAALSAQIRVFAWDQADGEDHLTPTRDLIASPPIAQVPPGGEQIMRLIRANGGAAPKEAAYRLLIDELPPDNTNAATGIQFRFRYSVPVFLYPAGERGAPDTHWSLESRAGKWFLHVANSGSIHARISDVTLTCPGETVPVRAGLLGYALAGRERVFPLTQASAGWHACAPLQVTANVNGKSVTAPVALEH
ncbi:fimbrial chaperone protein [Paraburkholderia bannensis]|uniref:Fimbrial chaperone protein n=1 Tax=Paraburkholderia bannensis TaxID=765414 RepID=A0A7W9TSX6_9BURK|nr:MULTISPECIES: molecular chaperone [Paraburkholderia]MBB3255495.1 fimbrial chaperone protein [Paraburkholderia sp. WP4_3_2]MBB6100494.1 fimbrial chaperone protein [Paraburkholderia bannensis]